MARIRTIKPEYWTSAQVLECSTNARLLFVGLWNFADDKGRHPDSPKQCKAEVFPADDFTLADVQGMLNELSTNGLIVRYVNDGKGYFYVPGWHHQRIDKPQPAKYPDPFHEHSANVPRTLPPYTIRKDTIRKDSRGADAPARRSPWGDIPDGVDESAWTQWTAYKGGSPKKATVTALRNLLTKHSPETQRQAVEHSIANGYAGLFPEKFTDEKRNGTARGAVRIESTLANLRRIAGEEEGGTGVDSAHRDARGEILDGVFERTQ